MCWEDGEGVVVEIGDEERLLSDDEKTDEAKRWESSALIGEKQHSTRGQSREVTRQRFLMSITSW